MEQIKSQFKYLFYLCALVILSAGQSAHSKSVCLRTKEVRLAISLGLKKNCALITAADLSTIKELSLKGKRISRLEWDDFAGLVGLERLDLSENYISELAFGYSAGPQTHSLFSDLAQLKVLDLSFNEIQEFPSNTFAKNNQLKELDLTSNRLQSLPEGAFEANTALTKLWLGRNGIKEIRPSFWSSLTHLVELDINNNSLKSIGNSPFLNLQSLKKLDLTHNQIAFLSEFDFANLLQLEVLNLSANKIAKIDSKAFWSLPNLRELNLNSNAFVAMPDLNFNAIETIWPKAFMQASGGAIGRLDVSYNPLNEATRLRLLDEFKSSKDMRLVVLPLQPNLPPPTRESVENKIGNVTRLLTVSSINKEIDDSKVADALKMRDHSRDLLNEAKEFFNSKNYETANALLNEASRNMFAAHQLVKKGDSNIAKQRYLSFRESTKSLDQAMLRIAAEKNKTEEALKISQGGQQILKQSDDLLKKDKAEEAIKILNSAYQMIKQEIYDLRNGETIVKPIRFANKAEEYAYELDRNESLLLLLYSVYEPPAFELDPKLAYVIADNKESRAQAHDLAKSGQYEEAIDTLLPNTRLLIRTLNNAGLYIPGGAG